MDTAIGGGIGWLSTPGSSFNAINLWDYGRWIQQSYYGRMDGSTWMSQPWRYNPVQVGSWQNQPAQLHMARQINHNGMPAIEVSVTPRNWASQALLYECNMFSRAVLYPQWVHVQNTLTYRGPDVHSVYNQELPAVFLHRSFSKLVYYKGQRPWSRDAVQEAWPGPPNTSHRDRLTEQWIAYINPQTGVGVGIYSPLATLFTSYRVGPEIGQPGSRPLSDCSYFAPIANFAIKPGKISYDLYILMGTLAEIRASVYRIAGK